MDLDRLRHIGHLAVKVILALAAAGSFFAAGYYHHS